MDNRTGPVGDSWSIFGRYLQAWESGDPHALHSVYDGRLLGSQRAKRSPVPSRSRRYLSNLRCFSHVIRLDLMASGEEIQSN